MLVKICRVQWITLGLESTYDLIGTLKPLWWWWCTISIFLAIVNLQIIAVSLFVVVTCCWALNYLIVRRNSVVAYVLINLLRVINKHHEVLAFEWVNRVLECLIVRNASAVIWLHIFPQKFVLNDALLVRKSSFWLFFIMKVLVREICLKKLLWKSVLVSRTERLFSLTILDRTSDDVLWWEIYFNLILSTRASYSFSFTLIHFNKTSFFCCVVLTFIIELKVYTGRQVRIKVEAYLTRFWVASWCYHSIIDRLYLENWISLWLSQRISTAFFATNSLPVNFVWWATFFENDFMHWFVLSRKHESCCLFII